MTESKHMIWNGRELRKMGDYADAIKTIATKEEGARFMTLAREVGPYADENIGYLTGYFDFKTAERIRDLLDVSHPIFGRRNPTAEEALNKGLELGRAAKEKAGNELHSKDFSN